MTRARCSCGNTHFDIFFEAADGASNDIREAMSRGPQRADCPKCGQSFPRGRGGPSSTVDNVKVPEINLDHVVKHVEREAILQALERTSGNRSDAAKLMGISRSRLYRRLEALGIPAIGEANGDRSVSAMGGPTSDRSPVGTI